MNHLFLNRPEHLLRGSASLLLRLCWDEVDSLGLAGLPFTRLSPALLRKSISEEYHTNYESIPRVLFNQISLCTIIVL